MKRCVFFDRDGIVNVSPGPGYVERWEDFHLQPEFVAAARTAQAAGYGCIIITNQRGVALGRMRAETLQVIHARLEAQLAADGVRLLGIEVCPHERDTCTCRKPQPGMLLRAAHTHDLDLDASWMVGDQETDVEAGRRAGCRTIRVSAGTDPTRADFRIDTMAALPALLEQVLTAV